MNHKDILKDLKNKKYAPIYLLHGEESYYIDLITNYIEDFILTDIEKSFNMTILYGKDTDYITIADSARRYPMMSERQIVIVKEAQQLKTIDELVKYVEHPSATTLLVLCHKNGFLDKRKKIYKTLHDKAIILEAEKLYDSQIPAWIQEWLKERNYSILPEATQLLAEYLGNNLQKIANELSKLIINLPPNATVSNEDIQKNIGISKDFNIFELQNALAKKDMLKIQKIVQHFIANPKENPLIKVIATLYGFFSKLYIAQFYRQASDDELTKAVGLRFPKQAQEYRTALKMYSKKQSEEIIGILKTFDLKSKGVDSDGIADGELLKEMIYKITHL